MKKIDNIIPYAFEAVTEANLVQNSSSISREYNGYISSFGASIRQSGLIAALVFNHRENSRSERDRKKLMDAIYHIVKKMRNEQPTQTNFLYYTLNTENKVHLQKQISDAATALKLVIRTYNLDENE